MCPRWYYFKVWWFGVVHKRRRQWRGLGRVKNCRLILKNCTDMVEDVSKNPEKMKTSFMDGYFYTFMLKVRQIRNDFFKSTLLPKNEQTYSTLLLVDFFSLFFWKKVKTPKRHFEINWHLCPPLFIVEVKLLTFLIDSLKPLVEGIHSNNI